MTPGFKVISSLVFDSSSGPIDFKGCLAKITGETQSYLEVVFYEGDAFMISKNEFISATEPIEHFHKPDNMHTADVTLWLNGVKIKTFRTLLLPNDQNYTHVKKNVLMWFKLSEGTHYDNITTELINQVSKFNVKTEMPPKAKTIKTNAIEDAVVVEETTNETNALTVAQRIAETLPAIPDSFIIDGQEYSVAIVSELGKEADSLLAKATPETYDSRAIWDEVSVLKNKLVKMRTTPDNKRKELSRPYQDFVKAIKEKTDAVGNAAKEIQDRLDAALQAKEDHEAEELRKKEEAKRIRTEERRESLRGLGGIYDVNTGSISFAYLPGTIVNQMHMMEYDDAEWNNQFNIIRKAWDAEQIRLATEKEKEEAEKAQANAALEAAKQQITDFRLMQLKYENFEFDEGLQSWVKGKAVVHTLGVGGYSKEDWDELIALSKISDDAAVEQPTEPVAPPSPVQSTQTPSEPNNAAVPPVFDPLAAVVGGMVQKQEERVEELDGTIRREMVFTKEKPYIKVPFKNSMLVVTVPEYSEETMHGIDVDKIVGNVNDDELGLKFLAIKK